MPSEPSARLPFKDTLVCHEVIDTYDGTPWLFVTRDTYGDKCLAYVSERGSDGCWYIVAPTSDMVLEALQANEIPLRTILSFEDETGRNLTLLVHVNQEERIDEMKYVEIKDIPENHLPVEGALLYPSKVAVEAPLPARSLVETDKLLG